MTVEKLMKLLSECDPKAEVYLALQPNYPLEHSIWKVVQRKKYLPEEELEEGEEYDERKTGIKPEDVLLTDGGYVRYGSRKVFDIW